MLKPLVLSASRGVIRADDVTQFVAAFERIREILRAADVAELGEGTDTILVEGFVPGAEVALEGLLEEGALRTLALFDKPDPLDGPFFEETIYVTPSRLPEAVQARVTETTAAAARALGLSDGAVHCELRLRPRADGLEPVVLEIAARSIGGLCGRTLRFGTGMSLEELILRRALGRAVPSFERERAAAAVMMIPIPRGGVLEEVTGLDEARAVPTHRGRDDLDPQGAGDRAPAGGLALPRLHLLARGHPRPGGGGPAGSASPPAVRDPVAPAVGGRSR